MHHSMKPVIAGVFQLARQGDLDALKRIVNDFNYEEVEGNGTVLMIAAAAGHTHIVQFLIEGGAKLDIRDKDGRTALMLAVTNNRVECVKVLLENGADPNICSRNGWSSLYSAANKGYTEIVTIILYSQAMHKLKGKVFPHLSPLNIDAQNMVGGTALMAACSQGHIGTVQHLLGWRANVNISDVNRFNALMKAAEKGHTAIVNLLLLQGAKVNATNTTGATALHLAAKVGSTDTVKALLMNSSINFDSLDNSSRTPLFYASQNGHLGAVQALWERGADANIPDKNKNTPLSITSVPEIQQLLTKSAPPYIANTLWMMSSLAQAALPIFPDNKNSESLKAPLRSDVKAVRYSEIPLFLRDSAFFRALNEDEDEDNVISVPGDCFKADDTVENVEDFRLLLRVMMFWGVDRLPFTAIKFCHDHDISMWDYVADDILAPDQAADNAVEPDSALLRSLTFVFRAQAKKTPLILAITDGRMEIIEALITIQEKSSKDSEAMTLAAELGKLEVMKLLANKGYRCESSDTCRQAAGNGHLDCLKFAYENGCEWDVQTHVAAATGGHLHCVKYAFVEGLAWHESVSEAAAQNNQLECLKYVLQKGCPASEKVTFEAAKAGYLECLRCALDFGCVISSQSCTKAAAGGYIDSLRLLHDHGAEWDETAPREAAQHGHLVCVQYLREHGCPWDASAPDAAARLGHLEILRYLMHHYCPYSDELLKIAVESGSIPCVQYLVEDLGLYMNDDGSVFGAAFRRADVQMVEFLLELGCPLLGYKFTAIKLGRPMGVTFDDDLLKCIEMATDRGWECDHELFNYVTERGLAKCKKFVGRML